MHPLFRHIRATHTADLNRFTPLFLAGRNSDSCMAEVAATLKSPRAGGAPMTDFTQGRPRCRDAAARR